MSCHPACSIIVLIHTLSFQLFSQCSSVKYPSIHCYEGISKIRVMFHLIRNVYHISLGAQGSKMSRAGPKGLKVVSDWKFCAESENQCLTFRTWEVFQIRRHCCHVNNLAKKTKILFSSSRCNECDV